MRRLAAYCRYLRQAIDPGRREGARVVCLCTHLARAGEECVGPFLEGLETECGLWEASPTPATIPVDTAHGELVEP